MKTYLPTGSGPCAKAIVTAKLVTVDGQEYESSNFCLTPQPECPRDLFGYKSGQGYYLCKTVCNQPAHAEENVVFFAKKEGANVRGSTVYVDYIWICDNCKRICEDAGANVMIKHTGGCCG